METLQILNTLAGKTNAWRNHPAVLMWQGHEQSLIDYGIAICEEWLNRSYQDTCLAKIEAMRPLFASDTSQPPWLGSKKFHQSHQAHLLRKDALHYGQFFKVPMDLEIIWPVTAQDRPTIHSRETRQ